MTKKNFSNLQNINTQIEATKNVFSVEQPITAAASNEPERKTKRFNLMFQPTLYARLQEIANKRGTSVGTLINSLCVEFVETQGVK